MCVSVGVSGRECAPECRTMNVQVSVCIGVNVGMEMKV